MKVISSLNKLVLFLVFPIAPCFAQVDSLANKSPKEVRMQVSVGNFELNDSPVGLEDWKKLASSSLFLKGDFSKYRQDINYITDFKPFLISIFISIQLKKVTLIKVVDGLELD